MITATASASDEAARTALLGDADTKSAQFLSVIERELLRPGITEQQLAEQIDALGQQDQFGIQTHWHKTTVRAGPNTVCLYTDNPPPRTIQPHDIVIVDIGPVLGAWEADSGRTYVLQDPANNNNNDDDTLRKTQLRDALEPTWQKVKAAYDAHPTMTAHQLYEVACTTVEQAGWTFGSPSAGHIIGPFPHEQQKEQQGVIGPGNHTNLRDVGGDGFRRRWILEIYMRSGDGSFGGFFEQLLG